MKNLLTCTLLFYTLTCNASTYEPLHVTTDDLKELNKLDEDIYKLSTFKESYTFNQVANFIYNNLNYTIDYSRLHVELGATARTSAISTGTTFDKDRLAGTITLSYPIFDMKETNDIRKKKIDVKQMIIGKTKDYFLLKAELNDLHVQKKILLELETRVKARKLTAVGSFDEWSKIMDNIRKINMDITKTEIELSESKQLLLSFVDEHVESSLEKML